MLARSARAGAGRLGRNVGQGLVPCRPPHIDDDRAAGYETPPYEIILWLSVAPPRRSVPAGCESAARRLLGLVADVVGADAALALGAAEAAVALARVLVAAALAQRREAAHASLF